MGSSLSIGPFSNRTRALLTCLLVAWPLSARADMPTNESVHCRKVAELSMDSPCCYLAFLASGDTLVASYKGGMIAHWDTKVCKVTASVKVGKQGDICPIAVNRSGNTLFVANNGKVQALDSKLSETRWQADLGNDDVGIIQLAVRPDSKSVWAMYMANETVELDAQNGERRGRLEHRNDMLRNCVFSMDSKRALLVFGSTVSIVNAESRAAVHTIKALKRKYISAAWSPNERTVAIVSDDSKLNLWNGKSDRESDALDGHDGVPLEVDFLDENVAISADDRGYIILWSVAKRKAIQKFRCDDSEISGISISPDRLSFAVGCESGKVFVYRLERSMPK